MAINHRSHDTAAELAHEVVRLCDAGASVRPLSDDAMPLWDKMHKIVTRVFGAAAIGTSPALQRQIQARQGAGHGHLPVCVCAWPRRSTRSPPTLHAAARPKAMRWISARYGWPLTPASSVGVRRRARHAWAAAREPSALAIDIDAQGRISGLF